MDGEPAKVYYRTKTLCPHCRRLLDGQVHRRGDGVFLARDCPEHGHVEALVCGDVAWYEDLPRFDVVPVKPAHPRKPVAQGCPLDCGLCGAHRQSIGTAAIEISNRCNANCPVCLADNQGTFEMPVAEVLDVVHATLRDQPSLDVLALSGGEPTIHPEFFALLDALRLPQIGRLAINSNGLRIADDDAFVERLAAHRDHVYVSLHCDGPHAQQFRSADWALQHRALERLCDHGIPVVPLVLGVEGVNDRDLGPLLVDLLGRPAVKAIIVSLMTYTGRNGSRYPFDPRTRLTIPTALARIGQDSAGRLPKGAFMPLPMPNPICAAIGYFLVDEEGLVPLLPLAGVDAMLDHLQNSHFGKPDERFEAFFRATLDRLYAEPARRPETTRVLARLRRFLDRLFPEAGPLPVAQRTALAEEGIKSVYLMQFMDEWTFDSTRLAKCSCQHLFADGVRIPSCGYYALHRHADPRFPQA